jgi:formamidopyrimidine-DNA glycosylase
MPELPDVEVARRNLQRWMVRGTIVVARCTDRYLLRPGSPRAFEHALVGKTVVKVERKGKWLRIVLDDHGRLFSHLGMTGVWVERTVEGVGPRRFERACLEIERRGRDSAVHYLDSRRFGRLVVSSDDIEEWTSLGPDPLAGGLDVANLSRAFARSRRAVKEILMDQSVLAGIGNILATEALWRARLDPRTPGTALSRSHVRAVARGLREEIKRELTERESPGKGSGRSKADEGGPDEGTFKVYGRAGAPCPRDGAPLARVTLGGRSTVFCKVCQLRPRASLGTSR